MKEEKKNTDKLFQKGLGLEYFTVGYNALEAIASIFFGHVAGSIALIGFGLDSVVESLSALVLIWRLKNHGKISEEEEEKIEKKAMFFVGITFFILAAYVLFQSVRKLWLGIAPDPTLPGIIIAGLSLIVMPILMIKKYRTGKAIGSEALVADSKETLACSFMSAVLLLGLGGNYFFGLWYLDPIGGLVIVLFLVNEGREAIEEAVKSE